MELCTKGTRTPTACTSEALSSRAKFRQDELLREGDDLAWFLPRGWLWPSQSKQPLGIRELPEVQLSKVQHKFKQRRHC